MNKTTIVPIGVKIENLSKVFLEADKKTSTLAVNHISLEIHPGELVTLLGPSGCGKTTILRMLSGFSFPTEGSITFGDTDVTALPPNKRNVGMMFQSYALFPHLSVYENIAYGLRIKKLPAAVIREKVTAVLDMMRITEYQKRIPEQLSGGQQQRVALARAVVTEPKILLFDEPLSNLDAKMREYMREELLKIQRSLNITSVYVTHDQAEAMAISDRVVIMNKGQIEQIGTPEEIYVRPSNTFVANFMGKANFTNGIVRKIENNCLIVETMGVAVKIAKNSDSGEKVGDTVIVMIRPEFMHIDKSGTFKGFVERATFFGEKMEYEITIGKNTLTMNDPAFLQNGIYHVGDEIPVYIYEKGLRVLPDDKE